MGHWYDSEGATHHQVINKSKSTKDKPVYRDTTIADARKDGWWPGFTAIGGQFSKPGLEAWKKMIMWDVIKKMEADPKTKRGKIETFNHWKGRVEKVLKEELDQYQKLGSKVHGYIETYLRKSDGAVMPVDPGDLHYLDSFREWYRANVVKVIASEQTFCSPKWGYGGCIDLQYMTTAGTWGQSGENKSDSRFAIVDYKTKRTTKGVKIDQTLEQKRQLVAYALGIGKIVNGVWSDRPLENYEYIEEDVQYSRCPILGNLYLSTTEPGRWEHIEVPPEEVPDLILDVRDCVRLWTRENNFYHKET